jgi:L-ascorbate metabolism protein UlaG (beta-lactamase superfamily)
VEVEKDGVNVVIDVLETFGIFQSFIGPEPDELVRLDDGSVDAALVTHLHRDHADVDAIERVVAEDGVVLRPPAAGYMSELQKFVTGEAEKGFAASAHEIRVVSAGETVEIGPLRVSALFAVDGLGSPQVSWLIDDGESRIVHGGDTTWHATWWEVAAEFGPLDVAFLPGNGAEIDYPARQPFVDESAVMVPEQSVKAATALGARTLIPIHFSQTFLSEQFYRPVPDARARIEAEAAARDQAVEFPAIGGWLEVGAKAATA